ncbi:ComF family protein [Lysobacter firmicutimachus]|uniref:ComF family protein n=1 Tax=Lysobacter firmicutimachus TaxID=1792846 RepID=A0AAU8MYE8_9GAMM
MTQTVNRTLPARVDSLWRRLGWALWPAHCLVCREAAAAGCDLCPACAADWPHAGPACLRCALPLPLPLPAAMPLGGDDGTLAAIAGPSRDLCGDRAGAALGERPTHGGLPVVGDAPVCGDCLRRPPPLDRVRAACLYRPPLDRLLPRFKFHRDLAAGRLLATMMAQAFAGAGTAAPTETGDLATVPPPVLIPVPLHPARLRRRGYDQALELARPLARRLGLDVRDGALRRCRDTAAQSRLDARQRRRNLRDAFAWHGGPAPAHAVLIDDVMTTGATLHAAARTLRRAGARRVEAWVCARVPLG